MGKWEARKWASSRSAYFDRSWFLYHGGRTDRSGSWKAKGGKGDIYNLKRKVNGQKLDLKFTQLEEKSYFQKYCIIVQNPKLTCYWIGSGLVLEWGIEIEGNAKSGEEVNLFGNGDCLVFWF